MLMTFGPIILVETLSAAAAKQAVSGLVLRRPLLPRDGHVAETLVVRARFRDARDAVAAVDNLDGAIFRGHEIIAAVVQQT